MIPDFRELREEHRREVVGPLLLGEIDRAVRAVIYRWPVHRLLGRAMDRWEEDALEEFAAEFAEYMVRGRLHEAMIYATSTEHLQTLLRARVRQFATAKVRSGESARLRERAESLLERDGAFGSSGKGKLRRWHLRGGPEASYEGGPDQLRSLARRLPLPPSVRRMRRNTKIASRVVSGDDLRDLLHAILVAAGAGLLLEEITEILDERLDLRVSQPLSLSLSLPDAPPLDEVLAADTSPIDTEITEIDAHLAALDVVRQLSAHELSVLAEHLNSLSADRTATAMRLLPASVAEIIRYCMGVIWATCGEDPELARRVLEKIGGA